MEDIPVGAHPSLAPRRVTFPGEDSVVSVELKEHVRVEPLSRDCVYMFMLVYTYA